MQSYDQRMRKYESILKRYDRHYTAVRKISENEKLNKKDDLYIHVFAPVLIEFVEWVISQAEKDECKRLYFLARDGWLMYIAAKELCRKRKSTIDCRYLRVSRYAVRMAEYHLPDSNAIEKICSDGINVTFEKIMNRAAFTREEAAKVATETGFKNRENERLTKSELADLKIAIRKNKKFHMYLGKHSKKAAPAVYGYLKQEGLTEKEKYALVDSGWIGTLQESIKRVLGAESIKGYYFGLYEIPKNALPEEYRTFYFGPKDHTIRKVNFSNCLFETIYSSPEGMTLGYKKRNDLYDVIKSEKGNPNKNQLIREHELIKEYVEYYVCGSGGKPYQKSSGLCSALLRLAMGTPIKEEAEYFGNRLFCDDVLESQMQSAAAPINDKQAKLLRARDSAWVEGSIVNNGKSVSRYLAHAKIYKWIGYTKRKIK